MPRCVSACVSMHACRYHLHLINMSIDPVISIIPRPFLLVLQFQCLGDLDDHTVHGEGILPMFPFIYFLSRMDLLMFHKT